jgi:hypothetical protein
MTMHRNSDGKLEPEYELPPYNDDPIMAERPSENHYLVMAAVWVPGDVLDQY